MVVPSCISSLLPFSETRNTWISKSFFSQQPCWFPGHFSSFLDSLPSISCISLHIMDPIHMPHSSVKPCWCGPKFPSHFVFLHPLSPAGIPNLLPPLFLLLCPHHCSSLWIWAAPVIFFSITEQKPDLLLSTPTPSPEYLLLAPVLGDKHCLLFTAPQPEQCFSRMNSSGFCFQRDFPGGAGSASGAVSVWIDARSSRHTPCCNNHGHLVLSWGEMCQAAAWTQLQMELGNHALIS